MTHQQIVLGNGPKNVRTVIATWTVRAKKTPCMQTADSKSCKIVLHSSTKNLHEIVLIIVFLQFHITYLWCLLKLCTAMLLSNGTDRIVIMLRITVIALIMCHWKTSSQKSSTKKCMIHICFFAKFSVIFDLPASISQEM